MLFARGKPPIPVPGKADSLFWIGWGPTTALGILFYLAIVDRSVKHAYSYASLAASVILIAAATAVIAWNRTDDIGILCALHLPFVAWAAVGAAVTLGQPNPFRQYYAFFVKSVETVLTGGIYFAAGLIFLILTHGIFTVLGLKILQSLLLTIAAWGIGAIPVLALASIYDPRSAPVAQDWTTGVTHILRIITQLILPLALGVLVVYILWFIPAYFWRPFQERGALIVYNVTILAILALLTVVVSSPSEERSLHQNLRLCCPGIGDINFAPECLCTCSDCQPHSEFRSDAESVRRIGLEYCNAAYACSDRCPTAEETSRSVDIRLARINRPGLDSGRRLGVVGTYWSSIVIRLKSEKTYRTKG
jgi:hypothetical protein